MDNMTLYSGGPNFFIQYKQEQTNFMHSYHFHKRYELYCLMSGDRTLLIDNKTIEVHHGSIIIIGPDVFHKFIDNPNHSAYTSMIMYFQPQILPKHLLENEVYQNLLNHKYYHVDGSADQMIRTLIKNIQQELTHQGQMYECFIYSYFIQLLASISRAKTLPSLCAKDALESEDLISLVILYINKHVEYDLSLETLANKFFVTPSYLSRKFKKVTSMNLSKYISEKRIQRAIWIIQTHKTRPLSQIAKECGFTSTSNFNRTFKEIMKLPPSAFKKNQSAFEKNESE